MFERVILMIISCNEYIIKNSIGEIFRFYLDSNNKINYDFYNDNSKLTDQYLVTDDSIIDFSLDIDNKDRIHLIYITNDGNLYYNLYHNNKWAKKILTQLDTKSNSYSNLILRVNNENIHILYSYTNLINPRLRTIQHLIGTKGNWQKSNVISFLSSKTKHTYFLDFDKFGNIHMVYTAVVENIQKIYYTFFNSSLKKWNQVPKLLSETQNDSYNPYILVDKIENIHVLWSISKNSNFKIQYKHLSQLGSNKNIWKEENLSLSESNLVYSIMLEEKDCIKIILLEKEKILSLVSFDYGLNWNLYNTLPIPTEVKIQIANYFSNYITEKNTNKSSQVLFYLNENEILIGKNLIDYLKSLSSTNVNPNIEVANWKNTENVTEEKSLQITELNIESKDSQLTNYLDIQTDISLLMSSLTDISISIKNLENIIRDFIIHFKDIDNTLLALKESIDINAQSILGVEEKIDKLSSKNSKKSFWSRLFKSNY